MSGAAAIASDDFVEFIATFGGVSDGDDWNEFFTAWLEQGDAVLQTGGDFGCYMQAVLFIIARYQEYPSMLDYHGEPHYQQRRVKGFFPDLGNPPSVPGLGDSFTRASAFHSDHYRVTYVHRLAGVPNPWKES